MLWQKSWLESRFRFLASLAMGAFFLVSALGYGANSPTSVQNPAVIKGLVQPLWFIVAMLGGMVAGAGINTQPGLQAGKGLHGSMLYTLSLPVSRLRLLAIRAGLGWMEMAVGIALVCSAMWFFLPAIRNLTSAQEMLEQTAVLVVCGTGFYSVPVLLATFLDDQGRLFGTFLILGPAWWISNRLPIPDSVNIFRTMGAGSPVLTHVMPWTAMACSLGLAAVLFFVAWKVVQKREY